MHEDESVFIIDHVFISRQLYLELVLYGGTNL